MTNKDFIPDKITQKILELLKGGTIPWIQNWSGNMYDVMVTFLSDKFNMFTGRPYSGINVGLLTFFSEDHFFCTLKQARDHGGSIKQNEIMNYHEVIFYSPITVRKIKEDDEGEKKSKSKQYWVLKYYRVYGYSQTSGLDKYCDKIKDEIEKKVEASKRAMDLAPIDTCKSIVKGWKDMPQIIVGKPSFIPAYNMIRMPPYENFDSFESYYHVLFHEMTHATGYKDLLARPGVLAVKKGSPGYAKEELIAEMGAEYLSAIGKISSPILTQNAAAYIQSWITELENDPRMVIQAANASQRAVKLIMGEDVSYGHED